MYTIKTNNIPRQLISYMDLPATVMPDFDYIDIDEQHTPRLFKYKGNYYDLGDMMLIDTNREVYDGAFNDWDAYQGESYFSGILVKLCDDDTNIYAISDSVIVASYFN